MIVSDIVTTVTYYLWNQYIHILIIINILTYYLWNHFKTPMINAEMVCERQKLLNRLTIPKNLNYLPLTATRQGKNLTSLRNSCSLARQFAGYAVIHSTVGGRGGREGRRFSPLKIPRPILVKIVTQFPCHVTLYIGK